MNHSKLLLITAFLLVGCNGQTSSNTSDISSISTSESGVSSSIDSGTTSSSPIVSDKFPDVRCDYVIDDNGYIEYQTLPFEAKNTVEYYESCIGLSGKDLKKALYELIRGHKTIDYDGISGNWASIYRDIDQDPNDSNGINLVYTGVVTSSTYFVREHIWPKSLGFSDFKKLAPGIDLHNLHPALSGVNSYRNNMEFDDVPNGTTNTYYGFKFEQSGNYVFEPIDSSKGDIARTIFYMAVRYEGKEKVDGVTKDLPDLELTKELKVGEYDNTWYIGNLETLLEWNELDPVDQAEVNRNEKIYSTYQNNRNPFIDHPEYARLIFDGDYIGSAATNENPTDSMTDLPLPFNSNKGGLIEGNIISQDTFTETLKGVSTAYVTNTSVTTSSNREFYISAGRKSGAFTLGYKDTSNRIEEKFYSVIPSINQNMSASSIEMKFDVNNCNGLLINIAEFYPSTAPYFTRDFHYWHILKSIDGGETYELVKTGTLDDVERYQISYLSDQEDEQVRFAFVIQGNAPRLNIVRMSTYNDASLSIK